MFSGHGAIISGHKPDPSPWSPTNVTMATKKQEITRSMALALPVLWLPGGFLDVSHKSCCEDLCLKERIKVKLKWGHGSHWF